MTHLLRNIIVASSMSLMSTLTAASTQVDFAISPFSFENVTYNQLSLDVTETQRFLQAHGALISTASGMGSPVTGTCFFTGNEGVFCSLKFSVFTINLNLDPDANGNYQIIGPSGEEQGTGQVELISIE